MENKKTIEYEKYLAEHGSVHGIVSLESFEDWKQEWQQRQTVKKMAATLPDYAASPEEIIEEREWTKGLSKMCDTIADAIGIEGIRLLYRYYVMNISVAQLADETGLEQRTIYRALGKLKTDAAKAVEDKMPQQFQTLTDNWFPMQPTSGFPTVLPFESEKDHIDSSYRYKGTIRFRCKCRLPEYFNTAFHDGHTRCSLCVDKYGVNTCERKGAN